MATALRFGPADHGRAMTFDEFITGGFEPDYRYEIIDGRLYVSPEPNQSHDWTERFVYQALLKYCWQNPEIIACVTSKARVFVPGKLKTTAPEPDIAAYRDSPNDPSVDWRDVSPVLVVEVMDRGDPDKDLIRNAELYLRVPSIEEYWLFDIREDPSRPALRVHRRQGEEWAVADFDADAVYRTDLLPGFEMPITPGRT